MTLSEFKKDYITIWNQAIAGIYTAYGFVAVCSLISTFQSCNELKKTHPQYYGSMSCGIGSADELIVIMVYLAMLIGGLATFFYTRRYFRGENIRTPAGIISSISLTGVNGYVVYLIVDSMIKASKVAGAKMFGVLSQSLGSVSSVMVWFILIAIIISFVMAILSIVIVFTNSSAEIKQMEKIAALGDRDGEKSGIAAEVATHAMGHDVPGAIVAGVDSGAGSSASIEPALGDAAPAPTSETPVKKDLPPMLSAEPDQANPEVGHGAMMPMENIAKAEPLPQQTPVPQQTSIEQPVQEPQPIQQPTQQPVDQVTDFGKL